MQLLQRKAGVRGNPAAFLTRAARNIAIDHLRRETTRRNYVASAVSPPLLHDPGFDALSARESTQAIRIALDAMPEITRMLFLMNRAEGMSFQEIAVHCGMSERNELMRWMPQKPHRRTHALELLDRVTPRRVGERGGAYVPPKGKLLVLIAGFDDVAVMGEGASCGFGSLREVRGSTIVRKCSET